MYGNPYFQQFQQSFQPQPQQPSISVAFVPTVADVERVEMRPGERKIVLVQNDPNFLAIRVADMAGYTQTEYRTSQPFDPKTTQGTPQLAPADMVQALSGRVDELEKKLEGILNAKPARNAAAKQPASGE